MHNDIEKVKQMVKDMAIKKWVAKHIKKKMYKINAIFKKMYPTGLGFTYICTLALMNWLTKQLILTLGYNVLLTMGNAFEIQYKNTKF